MMVPVGAPQTRTLSPLCPILEQPPGPWPCPTSSPFHTHMSCHSPSMVDQGPAVQEVSTAVSANNITVMYALSKAVVSLKSRHLTADFGDEVYPRKVARCPLRRLQWQQIHFPLYTFECCNHYVALIIANTKFSPNISSRAPERFLMQHRRTEWLSQLGPNDLWKKSNCDFFQPMLLNINCQLLPTSFFCFVLFFLIGVEHNNQTHHNDKSWLTKIMIIQEQKKY